MPKNKPKSRTGETLVVATFSYSANKAEELTFNKGQLIEVIKKKTNGWWMGKLGTSEGWVPSNFLEECTVLGDAYLLKDHPAKNSDFLKAKTNEWVYVIGESEENRSYLCVLNGLAGFILADYLGQEDENEQADEKEKERNELEEMEKKKNNWSKRRRN